MDSHNHHQLVFKPGFIAGKTMRELALQQNLPKHPDATICRVLCRYGCQLISWQTCWEGCLPWNRNGMTWEEAFQKWSPVMRVNNLCCSVVSWNPFHRLIQPIHCSGLEMWAFVGVYVSSELLRPYRPVALCEWSIECRSCSLSLIALPWDQAVRHLVADSCHAGEIRIVFLRSMLLEI